VKPPILRVFLSGGAGNQLFQIAFAHYLAKVNNTKVLVLKPKQKAEVQHAEISFYSKHFSCEHCDFRIHGGFNLINKLINPWNKHKEHPRSDLYDFRGTPYLSPSYYSTLPQRKDYIGYFQHHEFVQIVAPEMFQEINSQIATNISEKEAKTSDTFDFEIIHIRHGDTLSPSNKLRVGVLDSAYYERVLKINSRLDERIIITDDLIGARSILRNVEYDQIYGPQDLSVWSALHLMSKAKRVICANSTFSWWGGWLAQKAGAEVFIPEPFFYSSSLSTGHAFANPGFTLTQSSFLD